eukprot:TRINITY_DN36953_c0_g1_i1.p1 TRINITY_DN36953_c0_g1~~TRINITY_DN36953_c0_g1_i1.p1  ORF type:complete len:352 (-),score=43.97 TRINITY_DN36953_c0_g1_i1:206-1261(-)
MGQCRSNCEAAMVVNEDDDNDEVSSSPDVPPVQAMPVLQDLVARCEPKCFLVESTEEGGEEAASSAQIVDALPVLPQNFDHSLTSTQARSSSPSPCEINLARVREAPASHRFPLGSHRRVRSTGDASESIASVLEARGRARAGHIADQICAIRTPEKTIAPPPLIAPSAETPAGERAAAVSETSMFQTPEKTRARQPLVDRRACADISPAQPPADEQTRDCCALESEACSKRWVCSLMSGDVLASGQVTLDMRVVDIEHLALQAAALDPDTHVACLCLAGGSQGHVLSHETKLADIALGLEPLELLAVLTAKTSKDFTPPPAPRFRARQLTKRAHSEPKRVVSSLAGNFRD